MPDCFIVWMDGSRDVAALTDFAGACIISDKSLPKGFLLEGP